VERTGGILNNGEDAATIRVLVADTAGNIAPGIPVQLVATPVDASTGATPITLEGNSNDTGIYSASFTSTTATDYIVEVTIVLGDFSKVIPYKPRVRFVGAADQTLRLELQRFVQVGTMPYDVAVGDFDEDGKPDIASANWGESTLGILFGNGDGTFSAPTDIPLGARPRSIEVTDFDADGHLDIAVTLPSADAVHVLYGIGDGSFPGTIVIPSAGFPMDLATGHLDPDNLVDIAVVNANAATVSVFTSQTDRSFKLSSTTATGLTPSSIAIGELSGDSAADVVVANTQSSTVSVFSNDGVGVLSRQFDLSTSEPLSVAAVDVNGDSAADIIIGNSAGVSVHYANVTPNFGSATTITNLGTLFGMLSTSDVNGDGKSDLTVGGPIQTGARVHVLLGAGDGTFDDRLQFDVTRHPTQVRVSDVNKDGARDLVIANHDSNVATIVFAAQAAVFAQN